jgi:hypothetical protein
MAGPSIHDHRMVYHNVGGSTVAFEASDMDASDSTYQYYGFLSSFGSWIIQRFKLIDDGVKVEYRYTAGQSGYADAWAAKSTLEESAWLYFNELSS